MITLVRPAAFDEPALADDDDFDEGCIYCACRPNVSWCGAYDDGPVMPDDCDVPDCPDCVEAGACPNCGCRDWESCDLCCEESDCE